MLKSFDNLLQNEKISHIDRSNRKQFERKTAAQMVKYTT